MREQLNIEEIRNRLAGVIPGPWEFTDEPGGSIVWRPILIGDVDKQMVLECEAGEAEFIAHARMDVPALILEVDDLRQMVVSQQKANIEAYKQGWRDCGKEIEKKIKEVEGA